MPLFIGGPLDGKFIDVAPDRRHVEVAIQHKFISDKPLPKPNELTDIFYYKKEILQCPTMQVPVFVPRSYSCTDLMTALLEGYHQSALQRNE